MFPAPRGVKDGVEGVEVRQVRGNCFWEAGTSPFCGALSGVFAVRTLGLGSPLFVFRGFLSRSRSTRWKLFVDVRVD